MKSIYVCSRFSGDVDKNIANAVKYSHWLFKLGYFPVCVHIYLEKATGLSESKGDKVKLLELGKHVLSLCDEVWVFTGYGFSEGMKSEVDYAHSNKIPVRYIPFIPHYP